MKIKEKIQGEEKGPKEKNEILLNFLTFPTK